MNEITTTILKSINSVIAGKEAVVEKEMCIRDRWGTLCLQ